MAERSRRGFASMDPEKQRQIASKGGKAAHAKGTAHEFNREEAVEAGRKGGKAAHARGTAHRLTPRPAGEMPQPPVESSTIGQAVRPPEQPVPTEQQLAPSW